MDARIQLDRRRSPRRVLNRVAYIQVGPGAPARGCLITDISDSGVRLHVEGFEVPNEFLLLLSGEQLNQKERGYRAYRVVWRLGYEVGATLVSSHGVAKGKGPGN